jgi:hypothetical protein
LKMEFTVERCSGTRDGLSLGDMCGQYRSR